MHNYGRHWGSESLGGIFDWDQKKSHSKLEKLSICSLQSGLKEEVGHEVVCEKPLPLRGYCLWGFKGKVAGLLLVVKKKRWRS